MAKTEKTTDAVYDSSSLGVPKQLVLGVQHLFAMFGSTVLVPILTGLPGKRFPCSWVLPLRSWLATSLWWPMAQTWG